MSAKTPPLRADDFIERQKTGNWFDSYIATHVSEGRVMYPGPLDRTHAWAYLPDMARATTVLADKRAGFATFEEFGFLGYALTGRMLVDAMADSARRKLKVKGLSWPMIRLLGLAMPADARGRGDVLSVALAGRHRWRQARHRVAGVSRNDA